MAGPILGPLLNRVRRRSPLSGGQALGILLVAAVVILWVVPHLVARASDKNIVGSEQRNAALITRHRIFDAVADIAVTGQIAEATATVTSKLPADAYAETVSKFASGVATFIAGGPGRPDLDIELTQAGSLQTEQALIEQVRQLAELPVREMDNIDQFDSAVEDAFDAIRAGEMPEWLPTITASPQSAISLSEWILGSIDYPSPVLSSRIRAHLAVGDVRGALAWSAVELTDDGETETTAETTSVSLPSGADEVLSKGGDGQDASAPLTRWFEELRKVATEPPYSYAQLAVLLIAFAALLFVAVAGEREIAAAAAIVLILATVVTIVWAPAIARGGVPSVGAVAPGSSLLDAALTGYRQDLADAAAKAARATAAIFGAVSLCVSMALFRRALRWRVPRVIYVGGVAGVALCVVLAVFARPSVPATKAVRLCNGSEQLCEQRLNEVTFVGARDGLGGAESNWLYPRQVLSLVQQLDAGATLIDLRISNDSVDEELVTQSQEPAPGHHDEETDPAETDLGEDTEVPVFAEWPGELRSQILHAVRPNEACAVQCALGDIQAADVWATIATYLDDHPDLVLAVFVDDRVITASIETMLTDAGLLDRTFVQEPGRRWPKLGDLVDRDTRLMVFARHGGPPPPWLNSSQRQVRELDAESSMCEAAAGSDGPFTMLDVSVGAAAPSLSELVTGPTPDELKALVGRCADAGGRLPSFVLTDLFVDAGSILPDAG